MAFISTLNQKKAPREVLAEQVATLEQEAQAEADFARLQLDETNPWKGAAENLSAAKAELAELDEHARFASFGRLIATYRSFCDSLRKALQLTDRINELDGIKRQSNGYQAIYRGAQYRKGPPTSPKDIEERDAAKAWLTADAEQRQLLSTIDAARSARLGSEREHPFLVAYGKQLDAEHANDYAHAQV